MEPTITGVAGTIVERSLTGGNPGLEGIITQTAADSIIEMNNQGPTGHHTLRTKGKISREIGMMPLGLNVTEIIVVLPIIRTNTNQIHKGIIQATPIGEEAEIGTIT